MWTGYTKYCELQSSNESRQQISQCVFTKFLKCQRILGMGKETLWSKEYMLVLRKMAVQNVITIPSILWEKTVRKWTIAVTISWTAEWYIKIKDKKIYIKSHTYQHMPLVIKPYSDSGEHERWRCWIKCDLYRWSRYKEYVLFFIMIGWDTWCFHTL